MDRLGRRRPSDHRSWDCRADRVLSQRGWRRHLGKGDEGCHQDHTPLPPSSSDPELCASLSLPRAWDPGLLRPLLLSALGVLRAGLRLGPLADCTPRRVPPRVAPGGEALGTAPVVRAAHRPTPSRSACLGRFHVKVSAASQAPASMSHPPLHRREGQYHELDHFIFKLKIKLLCSASCETR